MQVVNGQSHWPIAIIGGGLAGTAAAAQLAKSGWSVLLIERDSFPRDKLCGEFLSGESRELLKQIGCLDTLLQHNPPEITQVRFISTRGHELMVPMPTPALGISRRLLDQTLFEHAARCGATTLPAHDVTALDTTSGSKVALTVQPHAEGESAPPVTCTANLLIAAYGRRSKLDRALKRPFLKNLDSSTGIKQHHRPAPGSAGERAAAELANTTEIYALNGGYCGIAPIEDGKINVCMLLRRAAFARLKTVHWPSVVAFLSQENPALGPRLAALEPTADPTLTVTQMPFTKKEPWANNIMNIGDAAAMIAPLCGDGMAMALESGVLAAGCINDILPKPDVDTLSKAAVAGNNPNTPPDYNRWPAALNALEKHWATTWNQRFTTRLRAGRALQSALLSPTIANPLIRLLQAAPSSVPPYLARITRG